MTRTLLRDAAARLVANNWRIQRRLPRLTEYAARHISRCSSPSFGGSEVYRCHELACPIHGDRNRQIAVRRVE